jgi:type I restriction-modification system DNA methylase subunit
MSSSASPTAFRPPKMATTPFSCTSLPRSRARAKGAVNLPHGVLFRGNAEADIRREIVRRGYIKGIIGLPANLYYGTGIPACLIVLDKENAAARKGIFMIDASKGFIKDGNKNRLRAQDIHRIVDVFTRQVEIPRYSRMVPLAEVSDPKNDFNLNLLRYIDSTEPEDRQDIDGHLRAESRTAISTRWRATRIYFPRYATRSSFARTAPDTARSKSRSRTSSPQYSAIRNSLPSTTASGRSLRTGARPTSCV